MLLLWLDFLKTGAFQTFFGLQVSTPPPLFPGSEKHFFAPDKLAPKGRRRKRRHDWLTIMAGFHGKGELLNFRGVCGCFLNWWYPQILHFNRVFQYKPSILGCFPIFGNIHVLLKLVHFCNPFLRANPTQDPVDFLADGDSCAIVKTWFNISCSQ